jgi:hypothetical protein
LNRRFFVALLASLGGAGLVAACSLGLDESKIGRRDGGPFGPDGPFDPRLDGGFDPDSGANLPTACTTSDECVTNDGCLKGKCDLGRKRCVYDVCRPQACSAGVCDRAARTCGAPTTYKYRAGQFRIGAQLDCARCAVAVYPWLFAITKEGPVAFNVANPTIATPPQVPVTGLAFRPSQIVQSGNRVWFLGPGTGAGPSKYQLAYLDAPSDPFAPELAARSVTINTNRSSAETLVLFQRTNAGALFAGPPGQNFPSFFAEGTVEDNATFTATPVTGAVSSLNAVAVSGDRLLTSAVVSQEAQFQLLDKAGTANPAALTPTTLTGTPLSTRNGFAASTDGAVTFFTGVHATVPAGLRTVRVTAIFIIESAATSFDLRQFADIETYAGGSEPDANAAVLANGQAMLDSKMAVVAAAAREGPATQTSVQFVKRDPAGLVSDGPTPRRNIIPTAVTNIVAATASNGLAYIVAHDVPPPGATVYVYDPGCAP